MNRGDVVLVDFPFSDRTGSKLRPALVVQSSALNSQRHDTVLAAITRTGRFPVTEVQIDVSTPEGQASGLRHTSFVDCSLLGTFDQSLIHTTLGVLPDALLAEVENRLRTTFALP